MQLLKILVEWMNDSVGFLRRQEPQLLLLGSIKLKWKAECAELIPQVQWLQLYQSHSWDSWTGFFWPYLHSSCNIEWHFPVPMTLGKSVWLTLANTMWLEVKYVASGWKAVRAGEPSVIFLHLQHPRWQRLHVLTHLNKDATGQRLEPTAMDRKHGWMGNAPLQC